MRLMYGSIEMGINILSYVNFSKICYVIKSFPELKKNVGKENINIPLFSTSREI